MIKIKNFLCSLPFSGHFQGDHSLTVEVIGIGITDLLGNPRGQHEVLNAFLSNTDVLPLLESEVINIYDAEGSNFHRSIVDYTEKALHGISNAHIKLLPDAGMQIHSIPFTREDDINLEGTLVKARAQYDLYKIYKTTATGSLQKTIYTSVLKDIEVNGQSLFAANTLCLSAQAIHVVHEAYVDKMYTKSCRADFEALAELASSKSVAA